MGKNQSHKYLKLLNNCSDIYKEELALLKNEELFDQNNKVLNYIIVLSNDCFKHVEEIKKIIKRSEKRYLLHHVRTMYEEVVNVMYVQKHIDKSDQDNFY